MTTDHIDQLAQWYADAEQVTKTTLPNKGDTLIYPRRTSGYIIESDGGGWTPELVRSTGETVRILARAPKPKPAWHDAVAVIAHTDDGHIRQVWERDGDTVYWCGTEGYLVRTEKLRDVTPLIEAKVTDEMVERLESRFNEAAAASLPAGLARRMLTVALGLEAE